MPKRRFNPHMMLREFRYLNTDYVNKNYLKNLRAIYMDMKENYDLNRRDLDFILFMYDYEFFSSRHIADALDMSHDSMQRNVLFELRKKGLVQTIYHKGMAKENVSREAYMFILENGMGKRYSLSQKARLHVQRFYRKLDGTEPIKSSRDILISSRSQNEFKERNS